MHFQQKLKKEWKKCYLELSKYFGIIYNSHYKTFQNTEHIKKAKHPLSGEINIAYTISTWCITNTSAFFPMVLESAF